MNKLSTIVIMCLAGGLLVSCKPLIIRLSGLKQPKPESVASVTGYLKKHHIDRYDSLYVCRDSAALLSIMSRITNYPATLLFDRQGQSVRQSDSGYCPGKVEEFMKTLDRTSPLIHDQAYSRNEFSPWIEAVEGRSQTDQEADFTLFVFWAKYCGSLNQGAFRVMQALQDNPAVSSTVCLVNIDFLATWGMNTDPKFHYH